jgi:hypothetical protein
VSKRKKRSHKARNRSESGEPGGGAGRRDEDVGGSGVYPAFSANAPKDAETRAASEWGQKLGGEEGGSSELNPYKLGLSDEDLENLEKSE